MLKNSMYVAAGVCTGIVLMLIGLWINPWIALWPCIFSRHSCLWG